MSRLLYLLRHGETAAPGLLHGHSAIPVTSAGIAACRTQAEGLVTTGLVASDLPRARDCALAIGTPRLDQRWRELDFGRWDGCAPAALDQAALARFWADPDRHPPPGGERWSALVARVAAALDDLPDGPVLVVTHGGPIRATLHLLCGFDLAATWAFAVPCAALLALEVHDGPPRSAQVAGLWP